MTGRTVAVGIFNTGALTAPDSLNPPSRLRAHLVGAVLACLLAVALAALLSPSSPRGHSASQRGSQSRSSTRLPVSLAAAASASIGASEHSFWAVRHGASLLTEGGGIRGSFTASGAHVSVAQGTLGLSLTAFGRGRPLEHMKAVAPSGATSEVLYRHASIDEFYRNGPYGLEQGFNLPKRPQAGSGQLVLSLALTGSLTPEQVGSQILFRTHSGATALRYGQLSVSDATGRRLPARMRLHSGALQLQVDDSRARYPLRVDPFVQQGEKLHGDDVGAGGFGRSVALSADGNTALIGGGGDDFERGAVWVFTRSGSTWTQQGEKLTGSGESGEAEFGERVALSGDGNTALIGGRVDNIAGEEDNEPVGAAWVFTRSGSTWTQQGEKLTGSGETRGEFFGESVALSSDGNTALVGGPGDEGGAGSAWVFTRSGSTWTEGEKLTSSGDGGFGISVALSDDGHTALVGDTTGAGAAWVFTRSESTWTEGEKLTGSGESSESEFGFVVALAGDGNTALIGDPIDSGGVGAAWVFTRSESTWTQPGEKLTGSDEVGAGGFGESIALSGDGNTALIGGSGDNENVGAAWVFTRSESTWTQGDKLTGSGESKEGRFGESVALSDDGNTALVGSEVDDSALGAAWVLTRADSTWAQQGEKLTGRGEIGPGEFGLSVAFARDGNTALIGAPDAGEGGEAWVFTRSGSTWSQVGEKLICSGESGFAGFGSSVALSADGNTALIGAQGDNNGVGAAWVFSRSGSTWTQQGEKLTGSGEIGGATFGSSVALSDNGNTALIGGDRDNRNRGAAWVFARSDSTWTQQGGKLTGSTERVETEVGESVALSGDGNTALIAGRRFAQRSGPNQSSGGVWVFTRSQTTWTQQGEALTDGGSVALSDDGNTALIGAPGGFRLSGRAVVFTRSGSTWTEGESLSGIGEDTEAEFGFAVALSSDGNTALIGGPGEDGGVGAAWVFTRSGSTWTQLGEKLTAAGESGAGNFGSGVALSGDGSTALIGGSADKSPVGAVPLGAAWVFANSSPSVPPTVVGEEPTSVTQTSATLNATVNPNSQTVSDCHFEYGPTEAYGSSAPCTMPLGEGESPVAVSAPVSGLSANTTYHYRIVATNPSGTSEGPDQTLQLPAYPTVESMGSTPGPVEVVGPAGTLASALSVEPVSSVGLPAGAVAVVGGLSFSVSGVPVGGSIEVTLNLPPGSEPTNLYKLVGGIYSDVTSLSTISGDSITLQLTDGGPGDEDGLANGVIVDPLVPVHQQPPTVTGVSPKEGPQAGGTSVSITGTNLSGTRAVRFGSANATSFEVTPEGSITAVAPAGTGTVDVTVTTSGGTSAVSAADQFSYLLPPTVTQLKPTEGPGSGGSSVAITGTNLSGATAVKFGSTNATSFTVKSAASITAVSPAGTGIVDVTVTGPRGTSATSSADRFSYLPMVTQLKPKEGPVGTSVNITGTNLSGATAVRFGSNNATRFTVSSASSIAAVAPAGTGTVDVTVITPGGTSATSAADQFSYLAPTVTKLRPKEGPSSGGTSVTITGTNLSGATAVRFGSANATSFMVNSASLITAVSPPGTGTVDVTVTTPVSTSATGAADQFSYLPTVTKLKPKEGPVGTLVSITGTNLSGATAVKFGSANATSFKVNSESSITTLAPAGTGTVDVIVTTPGGTSATSSADQFSYLAPTVTTLKPKEGTVAGGTSVTITGTNLSGATAVRFGSANAMSFTVNTASSITAVSPPGTGTVDVTVITPVSASATSAADQFSYRPPTVTKLKPSKGPVAGATNVTVSGTGFSLGTVATTFTFGATQATSVDCTSTTTCVVVSPAHAAGTVDVKAIVNKVSSPASASDRFSYG